MIKSWGRKFKYLNLTNEKKKKSFFVQHHHLHKLLGREQQANRTEHQNLKTGLQHGNFDN